jgi:large subunit ribosomal protein L29
MKAPDLREKTVEDLSELRKTLQRDVFQNRFKNFTNRLDDTSAIRKSKRDLARVITLLHERELGIARAAVPAASPSKAKVEEVPEAKPSTPGGAASGAKAAKKTAPKAEAKSAPAATESKPAKAKKAPAKKAAAKKSEAK